MECYNLVIKRMDFPMAETTKPHYFERIFISHIVMTLWITFFEATFTSFWFYYSSNFNFIVYFISGMVFFWLIILLLHNRQFNFVLFSPFFKPLTSRFIPYGVSSFIPFIFSAPLSSIFRSISDFIIFSEVFFFPKLYRFFRVHFCSPIYEKYSGMLLKSQTFQLCAI